jgi:hypothetical protein
MKSEFDKWFKEQFGARPGGNKSYDTLDQDYKKKQWAFIQAKRLLTERVEYDEKIRVASYAWNAKGQTK